MYPPPPPRNKKVGYRSKWHFVSGRCTPPQEWKSWIQVKVTFCFWLMYPPPRNEKVGYRSKWHFASGWCTPPQEWKSWIQVKVTFCFWLMYRPPPQIEIGLNMNAIGKKSFQERSSSTFYQSTPPPSIIIIWFYAWTGNWWISISNGYMDSNPIHQPSPAKKLKLIFGLCSTSGDWLGWSMDSNPIHHPSPAKKIKCSFLDYVQLLMIGRAGWWTRTPSAIPHQPKK